LSRKRRDFLRRRHLSHLSPSGVSWFIILFSVARRNQDGTLLQDLRARTSERAILRQRSQNPCVQALHEQAERRAIEDKDDIFGFMHQSHISEKNVARLEQMVKSENPQVASLAAIVVEVAKVTAYKKRRLKILAHKHPELLRKLEETGLVFAHTWD
jgi:hypothetical protein